LERNVEKIGMVFVTFVFTSGFSYLFFHENLFEKCWSWSEPK